MVTAVRQELGPVHLLFWNPISMALMAPLMTATPAQLQEAYNVTVTGTLALSLLPFSRDCVTQLLCAAPSPPAVHASSAHPC